MTLEDFAHRCLMIKAGNVELAIPCCANCKYYKKVMKDMYETKWVCRHPRLAYIGSGSCGWLVLQPEDFCSRWEEKDV